ncbi:MAG: glycerate kinase [Spirochaetia bacterium]|nr:glycerate kinase [Spirochaetia bacterium]
MKFVLIPDSFKGTLSSMEICQIISNEIKTVFPDSEIVSIPIADGGEGTVNAYLMALGGKKEHLTVSGPYFRNVDAEYGMLPDGKTAVIEMAACSGLPLVGDDRNPELTTTCGVGELLLDAVKKGAKKVILGLGGSSTNDAGCGMASALGIKFYNKCGESFIPTGGTLELIERIDLKDKDMLLNDVSVITMCDISNPMYGKNGAAYVYGPQKGADLAMIQHLDSGLVHLGDIFEQMSGVDIASIPGSGSAGAMGAGMRFFLGAELKSGIQTMLDTVNFDSVIADADFIITGEGRMDGQSLCGKVLSGVADRAKLYNKPLIALVGGVVDDEISSAYGNGMTAVFSINRLPEDFSISRHKSAANLKYTAYNVLRMLR